jgi:hypothetical protein
MQPKTKTRKGQIMETAKTPTKADLASSRGPRLGIGHGLVRDVLFTDGAKHVADAGGAYWLLDEIALAQRYDKAVQFWNLTAQCDAHLRRRQWASLPRSA